MGRGAAGTHASWQMAVGRMACVSESDTLYHVLARSAIRPACSPASRPGRDRKVTALAVDRAIGHLLARPHAVPLASGRWSVSKLIRSAVIRMHAFILRYPHPPHTSATRHRPANGSNELPSQRRHAARTTSVGSPAFPSSSFCANGGTRGESTRSRTQPVPFGPATGNG